MQNNNSYATLGKNPTFQQQKDQGMQSVPRLKDITWTIESKLSDVFKQANDILRRK